MAILEKIREGRLQYGPMGGGGKGGGGGGSQTVQQKADPWKGLQPYLLGTGAGGSTLSSPENLQGLLPLASQWYHGPNPQYFPEQTYASQTPLELASQQMALDYAGSPTLQNKIGNIDAATAFSLNNVLDPSQNPALQAHAAYASQPIIDQLLRQALPAIRSGAINAGQYGSSRQGIAEGLALEGAADAIGATTANIYNDAYGQGLEHLARTMALAPMNIGIGLTPSQLIGGVGSSQRGEQQLSIDEALARHQFEQNLPLSKLIDYSGLLQGWGGGSTSTNYSSPYSSSPLMGALGGAQTGYGLATTLGPSGLGLIGSGLGLPFSIGGAILGGLFSR